MSQGDGFKVWDTVRDNPASSWESGGREHVTHVCRLSEDCSELEPHENGQVRKDACPELLSSARPHPLLRNDCRGCPGGKACRR